MPIVNKIELQAADVPATVQQLKEQFDFAEKDMLFISAKEGKNVEQVFEAIIDRIPGPKLIKEHNDVAENKVVK